MARVARSGTAAIPPLLKSLNERTVLDTIHLAAPISRAEISRRAGISKPTVSLALQSLLEAGLVREAAHDPDGPSYGALFFEPVPEAALVLGLDVGARFVRGAICDLRGSVRARQDLELPVADAGAVLDALAALRRSLSEATGLPDELIDAAVVGLPGVIDADGGTLHLSHFASLEDRPLGAELRERLGVPVVLENDINLAALGEQWLGVARGVDDFVFLSVGTGLGAGLVLGGELHRGQNGAAGELDYAFLGLELDVDPCSSGVSALAERLVHEHGGTSALVPPFEARDVFAAARSGDAAARAVVAEVARRIAVHIWPLGAVADVNLVVLGGGIGANGDLLLEPIRELLSRWLPYPPQVEVSNLGEAAILSGALSVGLDAARENVFANRRAAGR
jgi:predicted NBD/HSP70 family sugar kinase